MNDKCPYCGGILKEGTLYPTNSDKVYWLPEGENAGVFLFDPIKDNKLLDAGAVIFSSGLVTCKMKTYACKECKKLIIDYSDMVYPTTDVKER